MSECLLSELRFETVSSAGAHESAKHFDFCFYTEYLELNSYKSLNFKTRKYNSLISYLYREANKSVIVCYGDLRYVSVKHVGKNQVVMQFPRRTRNILSHLAMQGRRLRKFSGLRSLDEAAQLATILISSRTMLGCLSAEKVDQTNRTPCPSQKVTPCGCGGIWTNWVEILEDGKMSTYAPPWGMSSCSHIPRSNKIMPAQKLESYREHLKLLIYYHMNFINGLGAFVNWGALQGSSP
jgi:hypothetical protein